MPPIDVGPVPRRKRPIGVAGWTGVGLLAVLTITAILSPWISPYDPHAVVGLPFEPPNRAHLLGTNDIGQDIASELISGTRISLTIGFLAAAVVISMGTLVGLVAGYFGGWVDLTLMRLVDIVLVIPFLPLMILLAAYVGPSFWTPILVIGALAWARPARVVRAQVLSLRSLDYVQAAQALGLPAMRVLARHILPGVLALALAQFIVTASSAILIEASLSFLGLGDPTGDSWGSMLYHAQVRSAVLTGTWLWWVIPPGMLVSGTVVSFALIGFALEGRFNPTLAR